MLISKIKNKTNQIKNNFIFNFFIKKKEGLETKGKIFLRKLPYIEIRNGGKIIIENNVTLNSDNKGYHGNMYRATKIMVDKPGATVTIGENTRIHGSCIHAYEEIRVGRNCLIAANCQIFDGNGHDICEGHPQDRIKTQGGASPILIGDNVWIGMGCIILPGVNIGTGSVIGAGSIVTKDIPENVIAGGNPAKIIRELSQELVKS